MTLLRPAYSDPHATICPLAPAVPASPAMLGGFEPSGAELHPAQFAAASQYPGTRLPIAATTSRATSTSFRRTSNDLLLRGRFAFGSKQHVVSSEYLNAKNEVTSRVAPTPIQPYHSRHEPVLPGGSAGNIVTLFRRSAIPLQLAHVRPASAQPRRQDGRPLPGRGQRLGRGLGLQDWWWQSTNKVQTVFDGYVNSDDAGRR